MTVLNEGVLFKLESITLKVDWKKFQNSHIYQPYFGAGGGLQILPFPSHDFFYNNALKVKWMTLVIHLIFIVMFPSKVSQASSNKYQTSYKKKQSKNCHMSQYVSLRMNEQSKDNQMNRVTWSLIELKIAANKKLRNYVMYKIT